VIDLDGLGEDGVIDAIENARYPNRCIRPDVQRIESREIEWSDDHPLNRTVTQGAAYRALFADDE
jgi:hypothetical protein